MMTVEELSNTMPWGTGLGGQLMWVTSPAPRGFKEQKWVP